MTPEIVSIQPIDYGVGVAGQPLPQEPYGIRYVNNQSLYEVHYIYIYIYIYYKFSLVNCSYASQYF